MNSFFIEKVLIMIKRKKVNELRPEVDERAERKGREYGYKKNYAKKIGTSVERNVVKVNKPVAKDTNKTRRKMVKPTKRAGS